MGSSATGTGETEMSDSVLTSGAAPEGGLTEISAASSSAWPGTRAASRAASQVRVRVRVSPTAAPAPSSHPAFTSFRPLSSPSPTKPTGLLGCHVTLNVELINVPQENDLLKFTVTGGTGGLSTQAFFSLAQILLSR